jgi:hypothetical protein
MTIKRQAQELLELSTPVVQLWDKTLLCLFSRARKIGAEVTHRPATAAVASGSLYRSTQTIAVSDQGLDFPYARVAPGKSS